MFGVRTTRWRLERRRSPARIRVVGSVIEFDNLLLIATVAV